MKAIGQRLDPDDALNAPHVSVTVSYITNPCPETIIAHKDLGDTSEDKFQELREYLESG